MYGIFYLTGAGNGFRIMRLILHKDTQEHLKTLNRRATIKFGCENELPAPRKPSDRTGLSLF